MLPVSWEQPHYPPVQIDRNRAPPYPDFPDERVRPVLNDIAVEIVNYAVIKSGQNPMRMTAYNLLSQNGWVNPSFEEVFLLSAAHVAHVLKKNNYSIPAQAIYESAVRTILNLWSSNLVFQYPELQSIISPQHYEAASQNAGAFHTLKSEMSQMQQGGYAPQYHQQPQYGIQPQPVACVWDPQSGQFVPVQGGPLMAGPGYSQPGNAFAPMYPNRGMQVGSYPGHHPQIQAPDYAPRPNMALTRDYGNFEPKQSTRSFHETAVVDDPSGVSSLRQYDLPRLNQVPTIDQSQYFDRTESVRATAQANGNSLPESSYELISTTQTSGGLPVDRKQHEISSPVAVPTVTEVEVIEEITEQEIEVTVIKGVEIEIGLNTTIAQLRVDWVKSKDFTICRKHVYIPDIIISTIDADRFLEKYITAVSLSTLAISLQALSVSLINQLETSEEAKAQLTVLREFDNRMTKKVNEFMKEILDIKNTIDSFIEDFPDLPGFVLKKCGRYGADALIRFDEDQIHLLTSEFSKLTQGQLDLIDLTEGVFIGYLPNTYTVTLVPADRVTLELPINDDKFIVDPVKHKVLYAAVKDLFLINNPDNQFDCPIDKHILVTRDGMRYFVRETLEQDGFYLKKI